MKQKYYIGVDISNSEDISSISVFTNGKNIGAFHANGMNDNEIKKNINIIMEKYRQYGCN